MLFKQLDQMKYEITFETEEELNSFKSYLFPKKSLKAAEVMSMLDISRVTLCHYVKRGLVKIDSNYTGKQYRYDYESVMKLKNKDTVI